MIKPKGTNIESSKCKRCGKQFYRRKKRKYARSLPPNCRGIGSVTCSSKCSREYHWSVNNSR